MGFFCLRSVYCPCGRAQMYLNLNCYFRRPNCSHWSGLSHPLALPPATRDFLFFSTLLVSTQSPRGLWYRYLPFHRKTKGCAWIRSFTRPWVHLLCFTHIVGLPCYPYITKSALCKVKLLPDTYLYTVLKKVTDEVRVVDYHADKGSMFVKNTFTR